MQPLMQMREWKGGLSFDFFGLMSLLNFLVFSKNKSYYELPRSFLFHQAAIFAFAKTCTRICCGREFFRVRNTHLEIPGMKRAETVNFLLGTLNRQQEIDSGNRRIARCNEIRTESRFRGSSHGCGLRIIPVGHSICCTGLIGHSFICPRLALG